jgi:DMSO reductase anchor subunit
MNPAYSVIFFTAASGGGYGLLVWLGLLGAGGYLPADRWFAFAGFAWALGMVTAGLLSSTFHLGHPERAWRAFSQWRSSWLSREGVMSVITYLPAGIMGLAWIFLQRLLPWAGLLLAICGVLTILCTSMIYASLKTIRRWRHPLTPVVYLTMGLASGALWLACLSLAFGLAISSAGPISCASLAAVALIVAGLVKLVYWYSIDHEAPGSTVASATGLAPRDSDTVRLFAAPHTSENYLQHEMGFQVARKHALKLRRIALLLGFVVPVILALLSLLVPGLPAFLLLVLAVIANGIGVLTERWLFFAEARHAVTLYYGATAV